MDHFQPCLLYTSDTFKSSTFCYRDGADDVLHMGPVWDYDSALNKKFGYKSVMQIPKLDKVIINVADVYKRQAMMHP